jgi:hypothetical protein
MAPFIETFTSYLNDQVYDAKQKQWDEFINDAKNLLDNYHELLGIVEKITIGKLGEVNKKLKNLKINTNKFLVEYDEDKNKTIDLIELTEKEGLKKFISNLNKEDSDLTNVVQAITQLEAELVNYRQNSSAMETDEEEICKKTNQWEGFTTEQTQEWINIGLTTNDAEFATWLRDIKSKDIEDFDDPHWIKEQITANQLELPELRKEYFSNASTVTLAEVKDNEHHAVIEVVPTTSSSKY